MTADEIIRYEVERRQKEGEMVEKMVGEGMIPGRRYRIILKGSGTIKPREMVARFLEVIESEAGMGKTYYFSLRPRAGTQNIEGKDIEAIYETDLPLMLPKIYRPETRVL